MITTWLGSPIIFTTKYSFEVSKNVNAAVGFLLGTSGWVGNLGFAVPYGSFTLGDRKSNLTASLGYGSIWGIDANGGRAIVSIAGMRKVSKSISLVFDSFILPATTPVVNVYGTYNRDQGGLIIPGVRFQTSETGAFQFGFAGSLSESGIGNFGLPYLQWFRKF